MVPVPQAKGSSAHGTARMSVWLLTSKVTDAACTLVGFYYGLDRCSSSSLNSSDSSVFSDFHECQSPPVQEHGFFVANSAHVNEKSKRGTWNDRISTVMVTTTLNTTAFHTNERPCLLDPDARCGHGNILEDTISEAENGVERHHDKLEVAAHDSPMLSHDSLDVYKA